MHFGTAKALAVLRCEVPVLDRLYAFNVLNLVQRDRLVVDILNMLDAAVGEVIPLDL